MSETSPIVASLPRLEDYFDTRSEGFEEWVTTSFFAETAVDTEDERAAVRLMRPLMLAVLEGLQVETAHGRTPADGVQLLPRLMGYVLMMAVASALIEPTHMRRLAVIATEEFRRGAKLASDTFLAQEQRP